jgi:hypothetical protein
MNNNIYFNAALAGCIAGAQSGRQPTDTSGTAPAYVAIADAAEAFATSLDGLIAESALVSAVGGAQLDATTATIQANQMLRAALLRELCAAFWSERIPSSTTSADYAEEAGAIVGQWTAGLANLVIP